MTHSTVTRFACGIVSFCFIGSTALLRAQLEIGTWVQQAASPGLAMTIEACCNGGRRLIYRVNGRSEVLMTIDTKLDGADASVLVGGKPSGETMGIKRVDALHADGRQALFGGHRGQPNPLLPSARGGVEPSA